MPAFEANPGMPYWVDLVSEDPAAAAQFYSELLGWETSADPEHGGYIMARRQGLPVAGFIQGDANSPLNNSWYTYFLTTDIQAAFQDISERDTHALCEPTEITTGTFFLATDPCGAIFGLVQPRGEDTFIAAGEPGTAVWHELACPKNFQETYEFYTRFFGWDFTINEDYAVAAPSGEGFSIAGIAHSPAEDTPGKWNTFIGVHSVDEVAEKAPQLGGQVLMAPTETPFGRLCIVADPCGAQLVLCDVDEAVEEGRESDPLHNLDLSEFED